MPVAPARAKAGKKPVAKAAAKPARKEAEKGRAKDGKAPGQKKPDVSSGTPRTSTGKSTAARVREGQPESAAPRRRRGNKRSGETIESIFVATETVILQTGTERISILDVCNTAGVSRGTFYRYFSSQEELLDAFSRHQRESFHRSLAEMLAPYTDPDARFDKLISYLDDYLIAGSSRRMLEVAPEFALSFFKRIFHDSVVRFQDLLAPVFDAWDERLGVKLDRELICDLIIRFVMSEHLVGADAERRAMPRRIGRLVDALRFGGVTRIRR
ncbi:TetR/AcrR family transcriptional regulator [Cupriavidus metallidurans]|uniref:TetR/AcrR family transcriptional regulator n=2 Tax=Burkholderiaceae TaxID=119060 RepID=A0A482IZZ5_9BURK|nr:TetR/AcrR family transcriptional regulator [Cupriavidus metallidurans]